MDIVVYTILWWGGYDEPAVFMSSDPAEIKNKYEDFKKNMNPEEDSISIYRWVKSLPNTDYFPTHIGIEGL